MSNLLIKRNCIKDFTNDQEEAGINQSINIQTPADCKSNVISEKTKITTDSMKN